MPYKRNIPRVCEQCGKEFLTAPNNKGRFCSHTCCGRWVAANRAEPPTPKGVHRPPNTGRKQQPGKRRPRGPEVATFKGERVHQGEGYMLAYIPDDSPYVAMRMNGSYAREHRYVMAQKLGRVLLPHEVVHHINGVRDDNRPENLQLMESSSDHSRLHWRERKGEKDISPNTNG